MSTSLTWLMRPESNPSSDPSCSGKTNLQATPQSLRTTHTWFMLVSWSGKHFPPFTWLILTGFFISHHLLHEVFFEVQARLGLPFVLPLASSTVRCHYLFIYVSLCPTRLWAFRDSDCMLFTLNLLCLGQNKCTRNVCCSDINCVFLRSNNV